MSDVDECNSIARQLKAKITGRYAYFDTVRFWLTYTPKRNQIAQLKKLSGSVNEIWKPMSYNPRWKHQVTVNQPSDEALLLLAGWFPVALINHIAIASDIITTDQRAAHDLKKFVQQHCMLPFKRRPVGQSENTTYWSDTRRVRNNLVAYNDKPCRTTGEVDCFHMERRTQGKEAVQNLGIYNFDDMRGYDFYDYWKNRLDLTHIDIEMMGREIRQAWGKSKRGPWITTRGLLTVNHDARLGGFISRVCSNSHPDWPNRSSQVLKDHAKTRHGVALRRCLTPIDNTWLLPDSQPLPTMVMSQPCINTPQTRRNPRPNKLPPLNPNNEITLQPDPYYETPTPLLSLINPPQLLFTKTPNQV